MSERKAELNRFRKADLVDRIITLEDANAKLVAKIAVLMEKTVLPEPKTTPPLTMTEAVRCRAARVYVTGRGRLVVSFEGRRYQHFAEVPRGQEQAAIARLLTHVDNGGGLDRARWVRM